MTLSVVEYHEANGLTVKPKTLGKITTHLFFFPKTPFAFKTQAENAKQTRCTCRVCQRFWNKNIVEVRNVRRIIALSGAEYRKTNGFTVKLKNVDWNDTSFFPFWKHPLLLGAERKRYASNGRFTYVFPNTLNPMAFTVFVKAFETVAHCNRKPLSDFVDSIEFVWNVQDINNLI